MHLIVEDDTMDYSQYSWILGICVGGPIVSAHASPSEETARSL